MPFESGPILAAFSYVSQSSEPVLSYQNIELVGMESTPEESIMAEVKQRAVGVKNRVKEDSLSLVAAGVAFYIFLSIFPALASVISIYGLIADPQTVENHVSAMASFMPEQVLNILSERMTSLAETADRSLTFGVVIGIVVSLWSANKAMKAIANALNIAYDAEEERGFVKLNLTTLGLTLLSAVVFIVAIFAVVVVPIIVSAFLTQQSAAVLTTLLSWALFLALLVGMCLLLYNIAPDRGRRNWKELLPGAVVAGALLIVASMGFSFYVANFGKYDEQYGALGAVVVTLLWLFIGAFIFLLGAELNAERIQHHADRARKQSAGQGPQAAS